MKKIAIGSVIFLTAAAIFWSCNKDKLLSGNATKPPTTQALTSKCALSLSYEVETTSIEQPVNDADQARLNTLEKISCEPHVSREAMSICIDEQGDAEVWETYLKPRNPYNRPSTALPNDLPQTASAHTANGVAEYFDEKGELLHKERDTPENLKGLIDVFKNPPLDDQTFERFVDVAKKANALLFDQNDAVGIRFDTGNGFLINVYDRNRKIQIAGEEYDRQNILLNRYMLIFEHGFFTKALLEKKI